jgi:hypothetical protein
MAQLPLHVRRLHTHQPQHQVDLTRWLISYHCTQWTKTSSLERPAGDGGSAQVLERAHLVGNDGEHRDLTLVFRESFAESFQDPHCATRSAAGPPQFVEPGRHCQALHADSLDAVG